MARRRQDPEAMLTRGKRLAEIREAYGLSQFDMAARLNEAAKALGLPQSYRDYTVSRNESGTISFEDAAVWLSVDLAHRGWDWFVFGRKPLARPIAKGAGGRGSREA